MGPTFYLFYFLSFLAVLSALMMVFSKNPVYSALYLVMTMFSIAGLYVLLHAHFLAAVHVIVYAGAIMVLFLYVIMLLNLNQQEEAFKGKVLLFASVGSAGLLLLILVGALRAANLPEGHVGLSGDMGSVKNVGLSLFNEFLLPFELASLLLLASMVGALMLGKPKKGEEKI